MEELPSGLSIKDWPTLLAIFKACFNVENILVKYLDDEDEEVGINSQFDLDYAYLYGYKSRDKKLRLVLRDPKGILIKRLIIKVNPNLIVEQPMTNKFTPLLTPTAPLLQPQQNSTISNNNETAAAAASTVIQQQNWLVNYLEKFKKELLGELDAKMNSFIKDQKEMEKEKEEKAAANLALVNSRLLSRSSFIEKDLLYDNDSEEYLQDTDERRRFAERTQKLLCALLEARSIGRTLKAAYIEEELTNSVAFSAVFIKDCTMPDGTRCEPNMKFQKTWLLKNTGKLDWSQTVDEKNGGQKGLSFPVRLFCIGGNIFPLNGDHVEVEKTSVNETASISVDLLAPSVPGVFFSEWVLTCNNFRFGPKIWCTIEVVGSKNQTAVSDLVEIDRQHHSLVNSITSGSTKASELRLQMDNEKLLSENCSLLMSRIELMSNSNLTEKQFIDDLDDEFVVVPDCFDLNKKWRQQRREELLLPLPPQDLPSITSNNSEQTLLQPVEKETEKEVETVQTVQAVIQAPLIDFNSEAEKERETEELVTTPKPSTFDLMKNAFSNLRTPSYVAPLDLDFQEINKEQNLQPSFPTTTTTTTAVTTTESVSTFDENLKKLVSMGFANRQLNERLLKKYKNNLQEVIQKLLERFDNNTWSQNRH